MTVELSITPVLDAALLLVALIGKGLIFHKGLKVLVRGVSQVSLLWSLLVAVIISAIIRSVPSLADLLPARILPPALALTSVAILLATVLLIRLTCYIQWSNCILGALLLLAVSMAIDLGVPLLEKKVLPEGKSFTEYRHQAAAILSRVPALATNKVAEETTGVLAKGLDALATLTATREVDAMKEDLSRGIELYAERKKLMNQMTAAELAEYHAEMTRFLAEQGMPSNNYSLANLQNFSSNDVAALVALLADAKNSQSKADTDRPVRSIAESLSILATNLTSLTLTEADGMRLKRIAELISADDLKGALASVQADLEASGGKDAVAIGLLSAMAKMGAGSSGKLSASTNVLVAASSDDPEIIIATPAEPKEVVVSIPSQFSVLKLPKTLEDQEGWIAVSEGLQIKGVARSGTNVIVVLEDGTLLKSGDVWKVAQRDKSYAFVLGALENGKVALFPLVGGARPGGLPLLTTSNLRSPRAQDGEAPARASPGPAR